MGINVHHAIRALAILFRVLHRELDNRRRVRYLLASLPGLLS